MLNESSDCNGVELMDGSLDFVSVDEAMKCIREAVTNLDELGSNTSLVVQVLKGKINIMLDESY